MSDLVASAKSAAQGIKSAIAAGKEIESVVNDIQKLGVAELQAKQQFQKKRTQGYVLRSLANYRHNVLHLQRTPVMLSLISTLGGLLISGLPRVLDFFQDKSDKKQELELARVQTERELALAERGFIAQQKVEEIRTDQIAMQSEAQMQNAALDHDKKVMEKASTWVVNYVGTVRPTVTYILILELVAINFWIMWHIFSLPNVINNIDDVIKFSDVVFTSDEMAMVGGVLGFWFGARSWSKK